jgi:hypothetical protein
MNAIAFTERRETLRRASKDERNNGLCGSSFEARKSAHLSMTRCANHRNTPPVFFVTSATILAATASIS